MRADRETDRQTDRHTCRSTSPGVKEKFLVSGFWAPLAPVACLWVRQCTKYVRAWVGCWMQTLQQVILSCVHYDSCRSDRQTQPVPDGRTVCLARQLIKESSRSLWELALGVFNYCCWVSANDANKCWLRSAVFAGNLSRGQYIECSK